MFCNQAIVGFFVLFSQQVLCDAETTTSPSVPNCANEWTLFPTTQSCYKTFFDAVTWNDAETTCRNNGGHLASIHSDAENSFITDLASEHNQGNKIWCQQTYIGMLDLKHNRTWSWSDGSSMDYFNWAPGEPNNAHSDVVCGIPDQYEYCVELLSDWDTSVVRERNRWNDISCEIPMRAFVCKRALELQSVL